MRLAQAPLWRRRRCILGYMLRRSAAATRACGRGGILCLGRLLRIARRALGGHRAEDRYVQTMRAAPGRDALDRAPDVVPDYPDPVPLTPAIRALTT